MRRCEFQEGWFIHSAKIVKPLNALTTFVNKCILKTWRKENKVFLVSMRVWLMEQPLFFPLCQPRLYEGWSEVKCEREAKDSAMCTEVTNLMMRLESWKWPLHVCAGVCLSLGLTNMAFKDHSVSQHTFNQHAQMIKRLIIFRLKAYKRWTGFSFSRMSFLSRWNSIYTITGTMEVSIGTKIVKILAGVRFLSVQTIQ